MIITAQYERLKDVQVISYNSAPDGSVCEKSDTRSSKPSLNSCQSSGNFVVVYILQDIEIHCNSALWHETVAALGKCEWCGESGRSHSGV